MLIVLQIVSRPVISPPKSKGYQGTPYADRQALPNEYLHGIYELSECSIARQSQERNIMRKILFTVSIFHLCWDWYTLYAAFFMAKWMVLQYKQSMLDCLHQIEKWWDVKVRMHTS